MLTISANARLFLCNTPVSMRKSFEGLSCTVEQLFPGELLSGAFFVFLNKFRNHIKILFGTETDLLSGISGWKKELFQVSGMMS